MSLIQIHIAQFTRQICYTFNFNPNLPPETILFGTEQAVT